MYKITLSEKDTPKKWYNIAADLPVEPPEYSQTEEGKQLENLPKIFSKGVLGQELSTERWIEIPKKNTWTHRPKYSTNERTCHQPAVTNSTQP